MVHPPTGQSSKRPEQRKKIIQSSCLAVSLSSLPGVLVVPSLRWKLLGLGPRSSWLDVLRGGVVHLVFFEIGRVVGRGFPSIIGVF